MGVVNVLVLLVLTAAAGAAEPLARAGHLRMGGVIPAPDDRSGVVVGSVLSGGPAEQAGLRAGDRIVRANDTPVVDIRDWARTYRSLRGGDRLSLLVMREGGAVTIQLTAAAVPEERIAGVRVEYGALLDEAGHRLRTIVARPEGAPSRLPAVLFVPWLSCSSVDMPFDDSLRGMRAAVHAIPRAGFLLFRVDKPSVGDSEGPDCSDTDLHTELGGYRAALRELRRRPDVDPEAIFVFGASLGGALAPLLAEDQPVRGLVVTGTHVRTWYEHMLDNERRRLALADTPLAERDTALRRFAAFYARYLLEKRMPGEVARDAPHLAAAWKDLPQHQYGRPAQFFHQVQELEIARAWSRAEAPVLVLYGENDHIMGRADHDRIVEMVNERRPGRAELVVIPDMGHDLLLYPDARAAFRGEGGQVTPRPGDAIVAWLRRQMGHPR
jgi:pimeloyl-ACP methyl ester carboxylesterase